MNLPNKITVARIILIFIVLLLANIYDKFYQPTAFYLQIITVFLTIIAAFTDLLDGYIARKYNLITDFGKLMDPLADKIFALTIFVTFVETINPYTKLPMLPGWVVIVVLTREFLVTGLRSLAVNKGEVISADKYGKLKTTVQMIFFCFGGILWLNILPLTGIVYHLWVASFTTVALITIFSGLRYFIKYRHLYLYNN